MTTGQTFMEQPHWLWRTGGFLASLLLGLLLGSVLLGSGVLLWRYTSLGVVVGHFLGLNAKTTWYFTRSSGTVAYLLLSGATVWGLLLSTKFVKELVPAALALAMHNILSWLAIALTGLHALALLFDNYYTYTLTDILLPFEGPYRPEWVGLGIIGLYLMALTSTSFSWRRRIGQVWWRRLHYLTFVAYIMATLHGVMAGTDSGNVGMQLIYWGSGLLVLFLTNFRLLFRAKHSRRATS